MLMSLLQSKGELLYPTLSIQGLQVDVTSTQNSIPINSTGARIEQTHLTFLDWNSGQLPVTVCGATKGATMTNYYKSNQLLCGFKADINANEWGSKHIRFLPKIQWLSLQIGSYRYPGNEYFDSLETKEDIAYDIYKDHCKQNGIDPVSFQSYRNRFFKLTFDYGGLQDLF